MSSQVCNMPLFCRAVRDREKLLAQTGCVSVEAVIKALPRVLAQVKASLTLSLAL